MKTSAHFVAFAKESAFQEALQQLETSAGGLPIPVRDPALRLRGAISGENPPAAAWHLKDGAECLLRFLFIITAAEVLRLDAAGGSVWLAEGEAAPPAEVRELAEFIRCDERPTMGALKKRLEEKILTQAETTPEGGFTRRLARMWTEGRAPLRVLFQKLLDYRNKFFGHGVLADHANAAKEVRKVLPVFTKALAALASWLAEARLAGEDRLDHRGGLPPDTPLPHLHPACVPTLSLRPLFAFLPESGSGEGPLVLRYLEKGRLLKDQLNYRSPHSARADWFSRARIGEDTELKAIEALLRSPETRGKALPGEVAHTALGWMRHLERIRFADYDAAGGEYVPPRYLWDLLAARVQEGTGGYIRLLGPGGCGKSFALKGWIDDRRARNTAEDYWLFLPFYISAGRAAGRAEMIEGLSQALRAEVEHMERAWDIQGDAPPTLDRAPPVTTQEGFAEYLWEIAHGNSEAARIILILDGLDEIAPATPGADLLSLLPTDLPEGLTIILSGREDAELSPQGRENLARLVGESTPIAILPESPGNRELLTRLLRRHKVPETDWPGLLAASGGRILYLRTLLRGLGLGAFDKGSLPAMEEALGLYLETLCQGLRGVPGYGENLTKTVALLAVAGGDPPCPVPMECLLDWGIDERFIEEILLDLRHFLSREREKDFALIRGLAEPYTYTLFHKELRTYLHNAPRWRERLAAARATIAEKIWIERSGLYNTPAIDPRHPADAFALLHGAAHWPEEVTEELRQDLEGVINHLKDLARRAWEKEHYPEIIQLSSALIAHYEVLRPADDFSSFLRSELCGSLISVQMEHGLALQEVDRLEESLEELALAVDLGEHRRSLLEPECRWTVECREGLAHCYHNRGTFIEKLGRMEEALADYTAAIILGEGLRQLLEPKGQWTAKHRNYQASSYNNRGNTLSGLGRDEEALADHAAAIALGKGVREMLEAEGHWTAEYRNDLASSYGNRAITLETLGRMEEALADYAAAIALGEGVRELLESEGRWTAKYRNDQASAYSSRSGTLRSLGRMEEALAGFAAAIALREGVRELLESEGRWTAEYRNDLASAYESRGATLDVLGREEEVLADYAAAIALGEGVRELLEPEGRWTAKYRNALALSYHNRGAAMEELGRIEEALADYATAIALREGVRAMLEPEGRWAAEYRKGLAFSYHNRGKILAVHVCEEQALADYAAAIALGEGVREMLEPEGRWTAEYREDLAQSYHNRGNSFVALDRVEEAFSDYSAAIALGEGVRELLEPEGRWTAQHCNKLASSYHCRGDTFDTLNRMEEALVDYAAAIALSEAVRELLEAEGRWTAEYRNDLASSHNNRATALDTLGRAEEALADYAAAIALGEGAREMLEPEGRWAPEYRKSLASFYNNRGIALDALGREKEASSDYADAASIASRDGLQ